MAVAPLSFEVDLERLDGEEVYHPCSLLDRTLFGGLHPLVPIVQQTSQTRCCMDET